MHIVFSKLNKVTIAAFYTQAMNHGTLYQKLMMYCIVTNNIKIRVTIIPENIIVIKAKSILDRSID